MTVKRDALDDYNVYSQEILSRTVWSENCRAGYKNSRDEGRVTGPHAGSVLHYKGDIYYIPILDGR